MKSSTAKGYLIGAALALGAYIILWGMGAIILNEDKAIKAAATMGFTNIEIVDSGFMFTNLHGCDGRDLSWYKAKAVNTAGQDIELRICKGLFKGHTVRVP